MVTTVAQHYNDEMFQWNWSSRNQHVLQQHWGTISGEDPHHTRWSDQAWMNLSKHNNLNSPD